MLCCVSTRQISATHLAFRLRKVLTHSVRSRSVAVRTILILADVLRILPHHKQLKKTIPSWLAQDQIRISWIV